MVGQGMHEELPAKCAGGPCLDASIQRPDSCLRVIYGRRLSSTRKDARRCRVGPLLVDLFLHIRVHLFCLQVSEHLGVEEIEVYQNSEARSVLKPSETHLYIVDMTKKLNRDIYT